MDAWKGRSNYGSSKSHTTSDAPEDELSPSLLVAVASAAADSHMAPQRQGPLYGLLLVESLQKNEVSLILCYYNVCESEL